MQQSGHAHVGAYGDAQAYHHTNANRDTGANRDTDTQCHSYSTDGRA